MKTDIILNIFYQPTKALEELINGNTNLYVPMNTWNLKGKNDWCDKNLCYEIDFK